jgi:hypothetical protein
MNWVYHSAELRPVDLAECGIEGRWALGAGDKLPGTGSPTLLFPLEHGISSVMFYVDLHGRTNEDGTSRLTDEDGYAITGAELAELSARYGAILLCFSLGDVRRVRTILGLPDHAAIRTMFSDA